MEKIFREGYDSFNPNVRVYDVNPYKLQEERGGGPPSLVYQQETTIFFNGWESARRDSENNKEYFLFLDDFRFPNDVTWINLPSTNWIVVRNYYDFVEVIQKRGIPSIISFDFDLDRLFIPLSEGLEYKTGLDCAKWLIEYCKSNGQLLPNCAIHSANETGRVEIHNLLVGFLQGISN